MDNDVYEYDVAFSFLKEDEDLAFRINDLIQDRVKTFIYSRQQEKIAGTDGEETFNRVFGSEARIVVVLYRENWGKTPWTRIEETAIRNRAYEKGYDFVVFIPLDIPPSAPKWLPKRQIWIGLDRWGVEGAASVIEARVQQAGGTPHEETALERACRIEREIRIEEDRKSFLESERGVQVANEEKKVLFHELEKLSEEISAKNSNFKFKKEQNEREFILFTHGFSLRVTWWFEYSNTLRNSRLYIDLFKGLLSIRGGIRFREPEVLQKMEFDFDRNTAGEVGWRRSSRDKRFFSSAQLAQECMKILLDQVRDMRLHGLETYFT